MGSHTRCLSELEDLDLEGVPGDLALDVGEGVAGREDGGGVGAEFAVDRLLLLEAKRRDLTAKREADLRLPRENRRS